MMNNKQKPVNTIDQLTTPELSSQQQQSYSSQIQQHQLSQQQFLQGVLQKNIDQIQQLQQQQQYYQQQGIKNNSLSMGAIATPNNFQNSHQNNQLQNFQSQGIILPPNGGLHATPYIGSPFINQQLSPTQKYQQLNNKAFSLIKNNYFKPNQGQQQSLTNFQQEQNILHLNGQAQSHYELNQQQENQQPLLNNTGNSSIKMTSNKKSPKISNHSLNKGNNNSGQNSMRNQGESIQSSKDVENHNGQRSSDYLANNQSAQKYSNQLPQSIDKTTHLQNLDKIRNNLNSKLQIQTELNAIVSGVNNIGLMNNQIPTNIFTQFPSSCTNGVSYNQQQQQFNSKQSLKKIFSITPQNGSSNQVKMFESQNKQINDLTQKQKKNGNNSQNSKISQIQGIPQNGFEDSPQKIGMREQQAEEDQNSKQNKKENCEENQSNHNIYHIKKNNEIGGCIDNKMGCVNNLTVDEYSKNSHHQHNQQDLDCLNLAASLMLDKLKKRDKNSNSAKGNPRNAHQSGITSNASYSKSSFPSNNSTTVNHYQGSNNIQINYNQNLNQYIQYIIGSTLHLPAQMISPNSNLQSAAFLSNSISNPPNKNMLASSAISSGIGNSKHSSNSKNQLSQTLSYTLQQYHHLMNHDLQQSQQSQQNQMKQIHSQSVNQELNGHEQSEHINNQIKNQFNHQFNNLIANQLNNQFNSQLKNQLNNQLNNQINNQINGTLGNTIQSLTQQQNNNLSFKSPQQSQSQLQAQKHRKVVSMSSSSPKYSKENMFIDYSKGLYNVDVRKLFKGQQPNTATNFHQLSNNQGNKKGQKQFGSGDKGEANFYTPHGNNSYNKSEQHADNTKANLKIKFSKTPGNMSFNNSICYNNFIHNHENSRDLEKSTKNQDKSKNFLSKITNHQGKISGLAEEGSQKKNYQKKQHKSQSCTGISGQQNKNSQNATQIKDKQKKGGSQVMIQFQNNNSLKKQNMYQSQADFSLLKQQLMEQQEIAYQLNENQQHYNQIIQNQLNYNEQLEKQLNERQWNNSCDNTTAVNSNAKDSIQFQVENEQQQINQNQLLRVENARIVTQFDQILKQRIDENSYSLIMDVFVQMANNDIYFQPSLQKFKICLDSLMHDMNDKNQNLKIITVKVQQLQKDIEVINNEKKQLQNKVSILQNENQQLLNNSAYLNNSNQQKQFQNINKPKDLNQIHEIIQDQSKQEMNQFKNAQVKHLSNQKHTINMQEKQTQTTQKDDENNDKQKQQIANKNQQILKEEIDESTNENEILRNYIFEQEKKLTAYQEKESSMIKLLLAIKKNGIDIDEIYEREVINKQSHNKRQNNQNNDEDDDQDDTDNDQHNIRSKFIDNIQNGNFDDRNRSQSQGFADESIINDSDESSFNYYGKAQNFSDSMLSQINPYKEIPHINSGRSKIEDGLKKKLKLNLNDLKKVNTQPNEDQNVQNNNNIDKNQQKQQQQYQMKQLDHVQDQQSLNMQKNMINNNNFQQINQKQIINGKQRENQNTDIFIEQEYQECNFDNNQNKQIIYPAQQMNQKDYENNHNQNEQYYPQDGNILQKYMLKPQKIQKNNQPDINEQITQNDYKVDSQNQNNFEYDDDQLQVNSKSATSPIIHDDQIDFPDEQIINIDEACLSWPDNNKPVAF